MKTVHLPDLTLGLRHAIQLDEDRYLLSQANDFGVNRVRIINCRGGFKQISSFDGVDGNLRNPRELIVDRNGFIIVSCMDHNKVSLLDSNLSVC